MITTIAAPIHVKIGRHVFVRKATITAIVRKIGKAKTAAFQDYSVIIHPVMMVSTVA